MAEQWRIQLLGGLQATADSRIIARFPTRRAGLLLAHLAFYLPRTHHRAELIELLWPEARPEDGRNSLRQSLHQLRQLLEPPGAAAGRALIADRTTVGL